ncbi:DGAT1/2-independent enzyme synthesizing storage lipids-like isoform X1 [Candoia aspera]|uniref:DGAT1/2-independent enzyme synthesizing storage lipids-like isoform X1 n=1 Tax=Candoia aspera TaxID=51853 RepID=UPI002FD81033
MINQNESCGAEQISISYLTCLLSLLEEWTGVEHLEEYLSYLIYLTWLFMPLLILLLLPAVIVLLLYISVIILHIYKRKTDLKEAYLNDFWDGARQMLATIWYVHARIWNGYELRGLEKIPDGPALIVFYHGATPIDFFYLVATVLIRKKRILHIVADHFVFLIPGMKLLLDVFCVLHGSPEECRKVLENGGLLPIIPMFTRNVRETIRIFGGRIRFLRSLYEYLRLPLLPVYGNFPVKLQTYFGDPIPYDPNVTAEELTEKAKNALQYLIDKHQEIPGNVWRALMERVTTERKDD